MSTNANGRTASPLAVSLCSAITALGPELDAVTFRVVAVEHVRAPSTADGRCCDTARFEHRSAGHDVVGMQRDGDAATFDGVDGGPPGVGDAHVRLVGDAELDEPLRVVFHLESQHVTVEADGRVPGVAVQHGVETIDADAGHGAQPRPGRTGPTCHASALDAAGERGKRLLLRMRRRHSMAFYPYLFFGRNCRQAFEFYEQVFGGELVLITMKDMPTEQPVPGDLIMHAALKFD